MKVVEGEFGKDKNVIVMRESVIEAVERAGYAESTEGQFLLIMGDDDEISFATSAMSTGDLLLMLEVVKFNLLS